MKKCIAYPNKYIIFYINFKNKMTSVFENGLIKEEAINRFRSNNNDCKEIIGAKYFGINYN